jgi:hypothetical protein
MTIGTIIAQAVTNPTTAAAAEPSSIWSEVPPWEIALLGAGALLTVVILGFFVWLAIKAGREQQEAGG